ncbi:MAG: hypothetical protein GF320_20350 [Armatimonadia bacterium]|nr:hypothetical protein [Armatimonadia bacterium]
MDILSLAGGGCCSLIWLGVCIWAIMNIVGSSATPGSKTLWILLILLLPVVGVILWLLLGPKQG